MNMIFFATGRSRSQPWFADKRRPYTISDQLREFAEDRDRFNRSIDPLFWDIAFGPDRSSFSMYDTMTMAYLVHCPNFP